jgi:hypothetical protein
MLSFALFEGLEKISANGLFVFWVFHCTFHALLPNGLAMLVHFFVICHYHVKGLWKLLKTKFTPNVRPSADVPFCK